MASYSLGIDLHKRFAYWTLIDQKREILFEGKVTTDAAETKTALANLPVLARECRAAIEPVELWGWYAELLESEGVDVVLANSLQTALIAKNRLKHDKVDAKILAELLQTGYLPEAYLAPRETRDLRELFRGRSSLVNTRTKLKNRIHTILAKHGLISPVSDLFGTNGLAWLAKQELRPIYRMEADACLDVMETLSGEISGFDRDIGKRAKCDDETKLLMTIPGVGPLTAFLVKAEVGDFARFSHPDKLASYAGLVASSHSSGGKQRYGHITKQGSKHLRWALVQAAARVKPKWGRLFSFHQRIKAKKGSKIARVALARKMLTVMWWLVKKKEPFRVLSLGDSGGVKR